MDLPRRTSHRRSGSGSIAVGGLVGGPPAAGNQAYTYDLVENNGNLTSIDDFNNLILNRSETGNLLKLSDVGEVRWAPTPTRSGDR